jgi:hypothetical protein
MAVFFPFCFRNSYLDQLWLGGYKIICPSRGGEKKESQKTRVLFDEVFQTNSLNSNQTF